MQAARSTFSAATIYLLCAVTSLVAALLLRQYQARRTPLLLWSCIAFFGLALNNIFVFVDFALLIIIGMVDKNRASR